MCPVVQERLRVHFRARSKLPSVGENARSIEISLPKTGEDSGGVDVKELLFAGVSRPARVRVDVEEPLYAGASLLVHHFAADDCVEDLRAEDLLIRNRQDVFG